ncbi:hypothetical protein OGAPHI_001003 [Ogataea philodendri]|uniref:Uncharacterized protein n=1 Tax=Ogataea philodendri TaxID=1378263 RepID=A0A9P8T8P0_9ASCO|nr:uncharacterized protein OGAPHI_001003 [Ogataea philodendri]KAH3670488.1 hypothetical protein OGAPHI_001003 [Ogataea philodendri]
MVRFPYPDTSRPPVRPWFFKVTAEFKVITSLGPELRSDPTRLAWNNEDMLASPGPEPNRRSKCTLKQTKNTIIGTMISPTILEAQ